MSPSVLGSLLLLVASIAAPPTRSQAQAIEPSRWLVLPQVDVAGRRPFRADAVFARHLATRDAAPPTAGEKVTGELGREQSWQERASEAGAIAGSGDAPLAAAYARIEVEEDGVWLAALAGAWTLVVDGSFHVGDPYGYGFAGVPVALRKGANDVYALGIRGRVSLRLTRPAHKLSIDARDVTKPDLVAGKPTPESRLAAVTLRNASNAPTGRLVARVGAGEGFFKPQTLDLAPLPPLGVRQQYLPLVRRDASAEALAREQPGTFELALEFGELRSDSFARATIPIEVKSASAPRRATFDSLIEGSIQSFALLSPSERGERERLVLALHGAGVDALAHASSYSAKPATWIVAPTNRRPYGFDWQDWGRSDAYETLEVAALACGVDVERVALTGHSMGGHGTWHLAANDPARFFAIAPSAGWASFDSYGGRPAGARRELWHAADAASRTEDLLANLARTPVFVVHGTADDNVRVDEAKTLLARLSELGASPRSHLQEGAGHWWDGDAASGVDCVDWPGVFELFEQAASRPRSREIAFLCADPSVQARFEEFVLDQPLVYGEPLEIRGAWNETRTEATLATRNLRRLRFECERQVERLTIDGTPFERSELLPLAPVTWFVRERGDWRARAPSSLPETYDGEKSSQTSGPFKRVFQRHFALVYGTHGEPQEDRELFERARHDQAVWAYRANGTPSLLSDDEFVADEARKRRPMRNVVLYGNADNNSAWKVVVPANAALRVSAKTIRLGDREWSGDDLACLFVAPRADLDASYPPYLRDEQGDRRARTRHEGWPLVGVVGSTGVRGARLGYTLAPFVSGVGYPDYAVFSSAILTRGDDGVLAAGWLDRTWRP